LDARLQAGLLGSAAGRLRSAREPASQFADCALFLVLPSALGGGQASAVLTRTDLQAQLNLKAAGGLALDAAHGHARAQPVRGAARGLQGPRSAVFREVLSMPSWLVRSIFPPIFETRGSAGATFSGASNDST
jgi:hypothetical protein